jgi:mRNA interferase MazF
MSMPRYSKGDVVLVRYLFSDRSDAKVRPAVVVSVPHKSLDVFVVPLTSKTDALLTGEFVINDWQGAGLNVISAVKRGLFTIHQNLIIKTVGSVSAQDAGELESSLRAWLGL